MATTVAAVSANFTRDLDQNFALIESLVREAREAGVQLLAFPEAAIGGYLSSLGNHGDTLKTTSRSLPPAIALGAGPSLLMWMGLLWLIAVLTGLAAARSAAAQQSEQPMSLWGAPETALRYPAGRRPLRPGPHAWRASSFPA